jgi:hypothetical protein
VSAGSSPLGSQRRVWRTALDRRPPGSESARGPRKDLGRDAPRLNVLTSAPQVLGQAGSLRFVRNDHQRRGCAVSSALGDYPAVGWKLLHQLILPNGSPHESRLGPDDRRVGRTRALDASEANGAGRRWVTRRVDERLPTSS